MPVEEYGVSATDAAERIARLLERDDVSRITVVGDEGEPVLEVPGTADPDAGARQMLNAFDEPDGAPITLRLIVRTGGDVGVGPGPQRDHDEPLQSPDTGEPESHGA